MPVERRADIGGGTVSVVGEDLNIQGNATGGVALVPGFLIGDTIGIARTPGNGPLDVVLWHRGVLGLLDRRYQGRVGRWIAATSSGRGLDAFGQLGEELAPLGVLASLAVLDVCPLGVTGH